jgi:predicted dehydrogenase
LRVAVIGVGHLGQHHARLFAAMPGVALAGVVDINRSRAEQIAATYGSQAFTAIADVLERVDAVTVAVPTMAHLEVSRPFLDRGVPVLIEKPIAANLAEADELLARAAAGGALLAVGHTERFNPAVAAALPLVSRPRFIEVHRLGTFPDRSLDIDVIFDLMIHDLDMLLAAVKSPVESVEVVGVHVLTPRTDIANARLRFANGCIANVTASRISRDRVRKARFFQHDSYVSIDYAAREVEVYRLGLENGRPAIQGGRLEIPAEEPLQRELADFIDAIRTGRPPGVDGRAGRDALALATRVADAIERADEVDHPGAGLRMAGATKKEAEPGPQTEHL